VRLFVGVELDDAQRAACARGTAELQRQLGQLRQFTVRWIAEENLHITLWFLGELKEEPAEAVMEALKAPWNIEPFTLTVGGAGAFPPSGPPRVVWVGVTEGAGPLAETYRDLTTRFGPLGYQAERRPYHPHVTIGRVKEADRGGSQKARDALRQFVIAAGSRRVTYVTLFRSHLSPRGARYEPVLRVPLKGC
jgi:RNA 2',3'-cyclic 3'-phosphodiesterase